MEGNLRLLWVGIVVVGLLFAVPLAYLTYEAFGIPLLSFLFLLRRLDGPYTQNRKSLISTGLLCPKMFFSAESLDWIPFLSKLACESGHLRR